jgi:hypothetical protein
MTDPLGGIVDKCHRGDHHLERVGFEVSSFLHSRPWHVAIERDPDRGRDWHIAQFIIERNPPAEWSIRVGEAVHQYRSGLDHLMTALSRLRHATYVARPDRSPNFPIFPAPGQFWARSDTGRIPANSVRKEVRPEHFTELERLQPRKPEDLRGSGELGAQLALAILRWMDDLDKHAIVRPGFIAPKAITYHAYWNIGNYGDLDPDTLNADFEEIYQPLGPLDHGTQLYRARLRFGPQMSSPMTIEPDVSFGMEPYEWVTLDVLRGRFVWVRRIIDRFREITPEFQQPSDYA